MNRRFLTLLLLLVVGLALWFTSRWWLPGLLDQLPRIQANADLIQAIEALVSIGALFFNAVVAYLLWLQRPGSTTIQWDHRSELDYLRQLRLAVRSRTYFAGASITQPVAGAKLRQDPAAYVNLSAIDLSAKRVTFDRSDLEVIGKRRNVLHFLSANKNVLIIGEPGSGKTMTALKYVDEIAARSERLVSRVFWHRIKIPVFIDLGLVKEIPSITTNEDPVDWLLEVIAQQLENDGYVKNCAGFLLAQAGGDPEHHGGHPRARLREYFKRGRLVIVLDAFNEVSRDNYARLWDRIKLVSKFSSVQGNQVVITGRERQYNQAGRVWGSDEDERNEVLVRLTELDDHQIDKLLQRLCAIDEDDPRLVETILRDVVGIDTTRISKTASTLGANSILAGAARNPLYLTLLWSSYRSHHQLTAKSISDLFSHWLEKAMTGMPKEKAAPFVSFLEVLAFGIAEAMAKGEDATHISIETADRILLEYCNDVHGDTDIELHRIEIEEWQYEAKRRGILAHDVGPMGVRFQHQRFLEFLAARRWQRRWFLEYKSSSAEDLIQRLAVYYDDRQQAWDEIIVMAASHFGSPAQPLKTIYDRSVRSGHKGFDYRLRLCARFIGSVRDDLLDDERYELDYWTSRIIESLKAKFDPSVDIHQQCAYVECLATIPHSEAVLALTHVYHDPDRSGPVKLEIVRQLANRFWDPLAQKELSRMLRGFRADPKVFTQTLDPITKRQTRHVWRQLNTERRKARVQTLVTNSLKILLIVGIFALGDFLAKQKWFLTVFGATCGALVFIGLMILIWSRIRERVHRLFSSLLRRRFHATADPAAAKEASSGPGPQVVFGSPLSEDGALLVPSGKGVLPVSAETASLLRAYEPDRPIEYLEQSPTPDHVTLEDEDKAAQVDSQTFAGTQTRSESPATATAERWKQKRDPGQMARAIIGLPNRLLKHQLNTDGLSVFFFLVILAWLVLYSALSTTIGPTQDTTPSYDFALKLSVADPNKELTKDALEQLGVGEFAAVLTGDKLPEFVKAASIRANLFDSTGSRLVWVIQAALVISTLVSIVVIFALPDLGTRTFIRVSYRYLYRAQGLIPDDPDVTSYATVTSVRMVRDILLIGGVIVLPLVICLTPIVLWRHDSHMRITFFSAMIGFARQDKGLLLVIGSLAIVGSFGLMFLIMAWMILRYKFLFSLRRVRNLGKSAWSECSLVNELLDIVEDRNGEHLVEIRLEALRIIQSLVKNHRLFVEQCGNRQVIFDRLQRFDQESSKDHGALILVATNIRRDLDQI